MQSAASDTSFDVQQTEVSSSKRKASSRAKRIKKRNRRTRYPKPLPDVGMSRPSSGSGRSMTDNKESGDELALEDVEGDVEDDDDTQLTRDSADVAVLDVDTAELAFIANTITAASDGVVKIFPPLNNYSSSSDGSVGDDVTKTLVNAASDVIRSANRPILRRQPSEYTPIPDVRYLGQLSCSIQTTKAVLLPGYASKANNISKRTPSQRYHESELQFHSISESRI